MPAIDLIRISLDDNWALQFEIAPLLVAIIISLAIVIFVAKRFILGSRPSAFEINEAEIGIGNQKMKIKPDYDDLQTAFKLWLELSTRKIGLPIDEENGVIVEVYNSWYEFFKITRELIKSIPVSKLRRHESTRQLGSISVRILHEGLRPHLTKWQARYRRWYQVASLKAENSDLTPQELQKLYPHYKELISDMNIVNGKLVSYAQTLDRLVHSS